MRLSFPVILIFLVFSKISAQEITYNSKFRGGMMLHSGYISIDRPLRQVDGICKGIGGQLSFTLWNRFRVGTEGYTSEVNYKNQEGYYKMGWGGLLLGYELSHKKFRPALYLTLGGGKIKDLYMINGHVEDNDPDEVIYKKLPVLLAVPSVNLEYSLSKKICLAMKLDYALPLRIKSINDFAFGPRLYLGIMFNH